MNYRAGAKDGRPSPRDEWRTPIELFRALDREFHFALDAACTSENQLAPNGLCLNQKADAMLYPWTPGPVWVNPPYSNITPWLERAKLFGAKATVVMLIPADPSTAWWRNHVIRDASEVRFILGRIRFRKPDGTDHRTKRGGGGNTVPSAIVVYRPTGGPPMHTYVERDGQPISPLAPRRAVA